MMFTSETPAKPFGAVGLEHIDSLYRYALVLTGQRAEAEDLVQKTYVRVIDAFSRLRENNTIKVRLFAVLRNQWINELRRRRKSTQFMEGDGELQVVDSLPVDFPEAVDGFEGEEDAVRVLSAISQLPSEFQEVLVLREFDELSYKEIAAVLNCPVGTVMSYLRHARTKMWALLS